MKLLEFNDWKVILVVNPVYWSLGKITIGHEKVYGYGWCFGPLEFQRWLITE
jgi:hypothetical protein